VLKIESDSNRRSYTLPTLEPGEVIVREFPIDIRLGESQGDLTFSSELSMSGSEDFSPADNSRTSVILFDDPAAEVSANASGS